MTSQPNDAGDAGDAVVDRFRPTSGRVSGVIGLVLAAVVLVLALSARDTGTALGVAIAAVFGGILCWATLLRPTLWATREELVVRGVLRTDHLPLAAIDKVAVAQVLAVFVDGRRYVSPAIGYTARETINTRVRGRSGSAPVRSAADTYQVFVEERIMHLVGEARQRHHVRAGSPEQRELAAGVRRVWAWPELAGLVVTAAAFVVWLVLVGP